jgi:hypothetical protein
VNDHGSAVQEACGLETEGVWADHYTIGEDLVDEVMLAYTV